MENCNLTLSSVNSTAAVLINWTKKVKDKKRRHERECDTKKQKPKILAITFDKLFSRTTSKTS